MLEEVGELIGVFLSLTENGSVFARLQLAAQLGRDVVAVVQDARDLHDPKVGVLVLVAAAHSALDHLVVTLVISGRVTTLIIFFYVAVLEGGAVIATHLVIACLTFLPTELLVCL